VNLVSTVCFDISDGSETVAPGLTLWVDGQNGAVCADRTTLRATTAFDATTTWPAGNVSKNKELWFGASACLPRPTITVSSVAALCATHAVSSDGPARTHLHPHARHESHSPFQSHQRR